MNWHVIDNRGRKWYPYVRPTISGKNNLLLHLEGEDTDMGDMFMHEVSYSFGPLTIGTEE